jgi:hypothetical protein
MKGGNSDKNGSNLDKDNILKSTFDILTEEDQQEFKAYIVDLRELFLSRCEIMWQGTVLRETTPIVFHKPEVISEVRLDPSPSRNDI